MLVIPKRKYRRKTRDPQALATQALTLVSASFNLGELTATLTFDRPIDIDGIDADVIHVYDGVTTLKVYRGSGATLTGPATVELDMEELGDVGAGPMLLVATDDNGIVATDGGTWAGADELPLPFP